MAARDDLIEYWKWTMEIPIGSELEDEGKRYQKHRQ
jgi:hypothetical protein